MWGPAWATSTGGAGTVTSFVEGLTATVHQGRKSLLNTTAQTAPGEGTAARSSVLAWRIPGAEEPVHRAAKSRSRLERLSAKKTETSKPASRHSLIAASEPSTGPDTRKTGTVYGAVRLHETIQCDGGTTAHTDRASTSECTQRTAPQSFRAG